MDEEDNYNTPHISTMNKIDLEKLEKITREIIETLEEEMPEDKSGLLCASNRNSPFRQLVGLLQMEMDSIRIMYSDLPLPAISENNAPAHELPTATPPQQKPPAREPEPVSRKILPRPASDRPREPATTSEPLAKPVSTSAPVKATVQPTEAAVKIRLQTPAHDDTGSPTRKVLLAAGGLLMILLAVFMLLRNETPPQPPAKIVVNWSDIEKGKAHADHLKEKVGSDSKNSAKSFYALGKKELSKNNLKAAREYFRTAVSLDPSVEEYMNAFRQVDYDLRKKSDTPKRP